MPFKPCFHRCTGECIAKPLRAGCAASCHPAREYVPPPPDSPVGRYLALLNQAEDRSRRFEDECRRTPNPSTVGPRPRQTQGVAR